MGALTASLFLVSAFSLFAQKAPFLKQDGVVLFQGDSITDGGRQRTGNDYNHTMGQDYAYILSAELGLQFADRNVTFLNRGISGNTVADLAARWKTDVLNEKPDLLSILVGVNDTLTEKAVTPEVYERTYDKLLADTLAALPGVKIVLGEPFVLPVGRHKATYASVRAAVEAKQKIVAKLAAKYHLPLIHYQAAFDAACKQAPPEHWIWDGIHPTYAGHALMAREWRKTVEAAWGQ